MRVTKVDVDRQCAVCERTLLLGERTIRFTPNGGEDYVDVCPLCRETALEYGWVKEGSPLSPTVPMERRKSRWSLASFLGTPRTAARVPALADPAREGLTEGDLALIEAADIFNASTYRRTLAGIAKSLGAPAISIVPLSGITSDLVVTVVWDISWYQYRVMPGSNQPVRLEERGLDPTELERSFVEWNATLADDGRIIPNIART
jgi:predicted RNA-binding Zn-ribbon protein involved in translation (DUF1610 family)